FFFAQLYHLHCLLYQVTYHAFHISTYISYFRKFGCFYFCERRIGNFCQTACYLCLPHTRSTNQKDVVGHNFTSQITWYIHSSPSISKCYRNVSLGFFLPDDIFV